MKRTLYFGETASTCNVIASGIYFKYLFRGQIWDSKQKLRAMRSVKSVSFLTLLTDSASLFDSIVANFEKPLKNIICLRLVCALYFSCHMLQFNYIRWNSWRRRISNWQIGRNLNYSRELISYYMRCNVEPVNVTVNAEFTNHCNERRCFAALYEIIWRGNK